MPLRRFIFLAFTVIATFQLSVAAQSLPDAHSGYQEAVEKSREWIRNLMEEENIPGVSVAVMKDGVVVWAEGFGFADLEQGVPITPLTKMRIGSVSKSITSAGMGILMDEEKLDIDAPIQQYLPQFPEKDHPITTRQLAGHLGGIRHYRGQEMMSSRHYPTVAEGLDIFKDDPLIAPPGERYSYSSYGWNLLSAVMEGASDEDFLSFMQKRVFDPIGMRQTTAEFMDRLIAHRTRYYVKNQTGQIENAPYVDNSYKWAGGGFISTAEDVVRFGHAMIHPTIFSEKTRDELWTSLQTNDGKETGYGLGWRTGLDDEDRRIIYHGGGSVGGTTLFLVYPEEDLILCLISNLSQTQYNRADRVLAGFFLGDLKQ